MQFVHSKVILQWGVLLSSVVSSKDDGGEQDFHTGVADVVNFESDEGVAHTASFRGNPSQQRGRGRWIGGNNTGFKDENVRL